jgi:hypothetical protein
LRVRRAGPKLAAMKAICLAALVACGDSHAVAPDSSPPGPDGAIPAVVPGCMTMPQPNTTPFANAADFGPVVPGTLAGWDPTGRWFMTGISVGSVSSVNFERSGTGIIVDRDPTMLGTLDDDQLFQHANQTIGQTQYVVAKRVSNRLADGTARVERAVCDGGQCRVCTAKLERATHNANEGEGDHFTLLGQLAGPNWGPGYTFNVRVEGTLAYLIRQDGLHIIETADPTHPTELGHYQRSGGGYSNDVKLVDHAGKRYALIADYPIDVVEVTDPANPHLVGQISEQAHTIAVESRNGHVYAYLGNYDANCPIYDVTDPTAPALLGSFHTTGDLVHDLSIDHGIAYLNAWNAGFLVVDYTTPATPTLVGSWPHTPTATSHSNWTTTIGSRHIALHGEEAYGAHLDIVDIDPQSATFMQSFAQWKTRDYVSIHNIMIFGTKAYFTYYQDGVRVLDLSDPAHPAQLGYYNTWDPQAAYTSSGFFEGAVGIDVDPARHLVFVADSPRGLLILQDTTP